METHTLSTDRAEIVYDVAEADGGSSVHPPLVMIGQPMDASDFPR